MKKIITAVLILSSTHLFAQSTSFKSAPANRTHVTGYGVLSTQFSKFNHQNAVFSGAYGGVMLNHKLMLGVGGYALVTKHHGVGLNAHTHKPNNWQMAYGGLMAEYTFLGSRDIHFTANVLAGGGILKNGHGKGSLPDDGADELKDIDASGFYVVQPSVNVEVNATRWFRIGAGVGYRYITGINQQGISNWDMSAPTASLSLKFGIF